MTAQQLARFWESQREPSIEILMRFQWHMYPYPWIMDQVVATICLKTIASTLLFSLREEAVSLVLTADMAGSYNLFADDELHRALFKLEAALPEEYRADVRTVAEPFFSARAAWFSSTNAPTAYLEPIRVPQYSVSYNSKYFIHVLSRGNAMARCVSHMVSSIKVYLVVIFAPASGILSHFASQIKISVPSVLATSKTYGSV